MTDVKKLNTNDLDSTVADKGRRHALKRLGLLAAVGYAVPTLLSLTKAHASGSDAGDSGGASGGDSGGASSSDSGGASSSDTASAGGTEPTTPTTPTTPSASDDTAAIIPPA